MILRDFWSLEQKRQVKANYQSYGKCQCTYEEQGMTKVTSLSRLLTNSTNKASDDENEDFILHSPTNDQTSKEKEPKKKIYHHLNKNQINQTWQ